MRTGKPWPRWCLLAGLCALLPLAALGAGACVELELCRDDATCQSLNPLYPHCVSARCALCLPQKGCCRRFKDCRDGLVCHRERCRPCSDAAPCFPPQQCLNGSCQPASCNDASDCKGGFLCKGGKCVTCNTADDCKALQSQSCQKGRCLRYVPSDPPSTTWQDGSVARSCKDYGTTTDTQQATTRNGLYKIQPNPDQPPFLVWCDFVHDNGRAGGWTLVLKSDGAATTFAFDSKQWQSAEPHQPDPNVESPLSKEDKETKLASFAASPVQQILLRSRAGWVVLSLPPPGAVPSLHALLNQAETTALTTRADEGWKALFGFAPHKDGCIDAAGTNLKTPDGPRVRLGLLTGPTCDPLGWLGVGGDGRLCGQTSQVSTGWVLPKEPCSGVDAKPLWISVFVRE